MGNDPGRINSKWVATFVRNRRPDKIEFSGYFESDYANEFKKLNLIHFFG